MFDHFSFTVATNALTNAGPTDAPQTTGSSGKNPQSSDNNGLNTGTIIGLVIGGGSLVAAIIGSWFTWLAYKRQVERPSTASVFGKYLKNWFSIDSHDPTQVPLTGEHNWTVSIDMQFP